MMNIKCHVYETNVSVCLTGLDNSLGWLIGPVDRLDSNSVGSDGSTFVFGRLFQVTYTMRWSRREPEIY